MANYGGSYPTYGGGGAQSQASQAPTPGSDLGGGGQQYSFLFKFIIIGDEAVGKTCLLLQFTDKRYRTSHQVTVGVEFGSRTVEISGERIKLQCWDTAGQDRFRSIVRSYYRGAAGALLVYDITRRDSFEHVSQWLQEARANADPELCITLVGNKSDKAAERAVSYEEGHTFAVHYGLYFLETSAVTGHMVDEAFTVTAKLVHQKNLQNRAYDTPGGPFQSLSSGAGGSYSSGNEYLNSGVNTGQGEKLRLDTNRGDAMGPSERRDPNQDSCCG